MSDEERLLWSELKHFRHSGFAFRKQAAVGPYVVDFLCRKAMLIIEVDGRYHDPPEQIAKDAKRTAWLEASGYTMMRFAAREVWQDMDSIITGIEGWLAERQRRPTVGLKHVPLRLAALGTSPCSGEEHDF